ncbi:hypothetical protein ATK36_1992 [Amycolatopsis sulphurea]|uniref:Uncharacterized protein n=1 Tax=Amycolatopsis sulphurea TaxID=76022 RepID=A0A2A9F6L1_9PSEU|nr:hypothetical protein [Amycolatopsis sulphurea]PFG46984.1 hypothetical protein ATK36_1992 [Amycolatopsis sulphurea]
MRGMLGAERSLVATATAAAPRQGHGLGLHRRLQILRPVVDYLLKPR